MLKKISVLMACFFLVACLDRSKEFSVDNPTDQPLTVVIDNEAITVPAQGMQQVTLKAGTHTLKLADGEQVKFSVLCVSKRDFGGLINPTRSRYIKIVQKYLSPGSSSQTENSQVNRIVIDNQLFTGPFIDLGSELFIDNTREYWDYGPTQPLPDSIETTANVQDTYKTKVFRTPDFIQYYHHDFVPSRDYEKLTRIKESLYQPPSLWYEFPEAELNNHLSEAIEELRVFLKAESTVQQQKLANQHKENHTKRSRTETQSEYKSEYYSVMHNIDTIYYSSIIELDKKME